MYLFFLFVFADEVKYASEMSECVFTVNRGNNQRSP